MEFCLISPAILEKLQSGLTHFLPSTEFKMQNSLNSSCNWSEQNLMLVNQKKSNIILYIRSNENFKTRIHINGSPIERVTVTKLLGIWLQEDLGWNENTRQICKKKLIEESPY